MSELLPCPLCGSHAQKTGTSAPANPNGIYALGYIACAAKCGFVAFSEKQWNHQASYSNILRSQITEMKERIRKLEFDLHIAMDREASTSFALVDMEKYAYRVGHTSECMKRDARIKELEAALEERDARINELQALVEKMKCCGNCYRNDCLRADLDELCAGCSVQNREKWTEARDE